MRVEFSSVIPILDVELGEIAEGHDLDVEIGLDEGDTGEDAVGDDARAVTGLGAPGDDVVFGFADGDAVFWGCPETPVL